MNKLTWDRRAAEKELENSVQLTRATLARIAPRPKENDRKWLSQTSTTQKEMTTMTTKTKALRQRNAASCRTDTESCRGNLPGHQSKSNVPWEQMGESFSSVPSHAYSDPLCTIQVCGRRVQSEWLSRFCSSYA